MGVKKYNLLLFKINKLKLVIVSKIKFKPDRLLKLNGKMLNISNKNNEPTTKAKGKFFVYCFPVSIISVNEILIIIITNKNKTDIRYTTDITGFFEVITNTLDIIVVKLNIFINTNFIFNCNFSLLKKLITFCMFDLKFLY